MKSPSITSGLLFACFNSSFLILLFQFQTAAQNIGIGTNNPTRKLSVNGTVMVDHGNQNNGTLDSAALLFGTGGAGITSKKSAGVGNQGLNLWTNGLPRFIIAANGNIGIAGEPNTLYKLRVYGGHVGIDSSLYVQRSLYAYGNSAIGGDIDPDFKFRVNGNSRFTALQTSGNVTIGGTLDNTYRLRVVGGNSRFGGDMYATGYVAFGGDVDPDYRLRVWDGDSRFGGNMHATGNVAFGGLPDNNFRLRVHSGSSYFGGPVQIASHLNTNSIGAAGTIDALNIAVSNTLTIGGNGSVRSNGPSPLRIGFDSKTVDVFLAGGGMVAVTANITAFSGGNDDVRVFVSQIKANAGNNLAFANLHIAVTDIDAAANTCSLSIKNMSNLNSTLSATIYLTTIAKN